MCYYKFMMKRLFAIFIFSALFFISCASTQTEQEQIPQTPEEPKVEIPVFDDWKHKGFGEVLPESVFKVVTQTENDIQIYEIKTEETYIAVAGFGINPDQAQQKIKNALDTVLQQNDDLELELSEESWVHLNEEYFDIVLNKKDSPLLDNPYIAYKIYIKNYE